MATRNTPDIAAMSIEDDESSDVEMNELTESLLVQLRSTIDQEHNRATFACGGSIPIVEPGSDSDSESSEEEEGSEKKMTSDPVILRWDPQDTRAQARSTKIVFPLEEDTERNLQRLVADSEPVVSGRQGDVHDETYRRVRKMNPLDFSSTFDPYALGIIDTIAQVLLPTAVDSKTSRAVRADLHKMNIYSGPSGKFKPFADTPRSVTQFGMLVVCLPVEHEGGQLQVRHMGKEMTFDWSTQRTDHDHASIRWAAFYSDCEHEVLEVLSGHRITLTYNLYAFRGNGLLAGHAPALDPSYIPLYQFADSMLREPEFMKEGGYLGFFCTHAYAHTKTRHTIFPDALKGLDMVLWETFISLGLRAELRPVIVSRDHTYGGGDEDPGGVLGTDFRVHHTRKQVRDAESMNNVYEEWENLKRPLLKIDYEDVNWLTKPSNKELQLIFTAVGNEPSAGMAYSHCAIVVEVPPFGRRPD